MKGLSRSNNFKKDTGSVQMSSGQRETDISPPPVPFIQQSIQQIHQIAESQQQIKSPDRFLWNSLLAEREGIAEYGSLGKDESNRLNSVAFDKDRICLKDNSVDSGPGNLRDLLSVIGGTADSQEQEKHQLVLPSRRKAPREEKFDRSLSTDRNSATDRNLLIDRSLPVDRNLGQAKEEVPKFDGAQRRHYLREDFSLTSPKIPLKDNDSESESLQTGYDGHINAILEVRILFFMREVLVVLLTSFASFY